MKFIIINGPNINMLGLRDNKIYGESSYEDLEKKIKEMEGKLNIDIDIFQTNIEGDIISMIQTLALSSEYDGLIINPGAYTHYSIGIRDALELLDIPIIEVHISNINKREDFRKKSLTAEVSTGQIIGLGLDGYILAIQALYMKLS